MSKWNSVRTIPLGEEVFVKTVSGIECRARTEKRATTRWIRRADRWGPERIRVFRTDGNTIGDVVAIGWKRLEDEPESVPPNLASY